MSTEKRPLDTEAIKDLKFNRKLIGGVDEFDVWRKLDRLLQETDQPAQVVRERKQQQIYLEDIKSFLFRLAFMIFIIIILFGVVFGIAPMRDDDMKPRISAGDLMLYYRMDKDADISHVYVYEKDGEQYVGRIVAQGGDKVEVTKDSKLKINDSIMLENEIYYTTPRYEEGVDYPVKLEENQYFILSDFREGGKDSRYFGPVTKKELKGKVITVIRRSGL